MDARLFGLRCHAGLFTREREIQLSGNVCQIVETAFQEMFTFYLYASVTFEFYLVCVSVIRKKIKKEKYI